MLQFGFHSVLDRFTLCVLVQIAVDPISGVGSVMNPGRSVRVSDLMSVLSGLTIMMTGIGSEVFGTNVVTYHASWTRENNPKFSKKFANPDSFDNSVSHNLIFSFSKRLRNCRLLIRVLSYKVGCKEH